MLGRDAFPAVRTVVVCLVVLGSFLCPSLQPPAAAATPHSYPKPCGYTGGPICPPPPPVITPWIYSPISPQLVGSPPFNSESEVLAAQSDWLYAHAYLCSLTVGTPTSTGESSSAYGILLTDVMNATDTFVDATVNNPPCTYHGSGYIQYEQHRSLYCPSPSTIVYQSSPQVGPYCSSPPPPPAAPKANVPKQIGTNNCSSGCPSSSTSAKPGGADAGSGRTIESDPVDVSNGSVFLTETDYSGTGTDPIKFVRSYSSLAGSQLYGNSGQQGGERYMGAGWSATYFQYLLPVTLTDSEATYNAVYAYRPDGRMLVFTEYNGVYSPDGDVADTLAQTANGWQYQTADDTIETYNNSGQLISIAARGHAPLTVNYASGAGLGDGPTSVTDDFGHSLSFSYAATSGVQYLASITDPAGNTVQYAYDTYGNLTTVTEPDATTRKYGYGASPSPNAHLLQSLTDESSVQYSSWTYNNSWQPASSQHAGGVGHYTFSYAVSGAGGSVTVTDPLSTARTYNQSLIWGVYRMTGASAALSGGISEDVARTYDGNGNITARTDFNGNQTTYSYDVTTNLETSRTEAFGTPRARTITTQWDPSWRQPDVISEPNRTTAFVYDAMGNVLTKTITDTTVAPNVVRTWTYTYDTYGRMLTADGPRTDVSDVTTYTYYTCTSGYQCGQLQTVTDAAGNVTTYNTYNAHGQPLTITDPNGVVTTLTYDPRQRLTSRTTSGETTGFAYYPTGLLQTVTLPDGSFLTYTYDGAHRLTQVTDGAGNKIVYTLDAMGNRTAENVYDPSNALHRTHTRVINSLNELYQDVNAAGTPAVTTTFGYDLNGNESSIAAPLSRNTANAFDELNRLKQIIDPASGVTQLSYDANDNLTSVTDPRTLATSYSYNGFGDLLTQLSPDTGTTVNTYDSGGNLATSTDARGAVSTYSYDALNRVTSVAYSLSGTTDQTIAFTYDVGTNGRGHLTGASDANHSMSWGYDALGRVTSKSQTVGTVPLGVSYGYTNADLTSVTTPSGQSVVYGYNGDHQIVSVSVNGTTVLNSATYEPLGPVNGWAWGNGTTVARTYDMDGKIAQIADSGTKTFSYDNAFRITGITDTSTGAANWTYGYDLLDRITSGSGSNGTTRGWTYDANGNRLTETGSAPSTYSISPTGNQITGITGALARTYGYDAAGNTLSYSTVSATYNDAGRLKTVTQSGATETLIYDALGQRIETSGGAAGTVLYAYDEAGHVLGEYDGGGNLIEETVWLGDIPVATLQSNGSGGIAIYYVHTDQLNTPRAITRPSDNVLMWTWYSDPFGTDAANENPAGAGAFVYNLRFAGQVFDGQAGLHANGFRDCYDPAIGRYCESDPIGLGGGLNTYAYTGSNPLDHVDRLGLDIWIEGPSGDEPQFHQSINVGDPFGAYVSLSFGIGPSCPGGCVYFDAQKGGPIESYAKSTPQQDADAIADLMHSMNDDSRMWYGPNTCRTYSQDKFEQFKQKFKLKERAPPNRTPMPRSWFRDFIAPTLAPSSSSSSSHTSSSR
jgi:RHS repeat-associated protein